VPGGESDSLVEEKQLRVAPFGHDDPVSSPELQNTGDPSPALETADDLAVAVVQGAASVAHHGSASGSAEKFTEWIDSVLKRHSASKKGRPVVTQFVRIC
jgi:hypothetical protein